jgi:hypothetical protein
MLGKQIKWMDKNHDYGLSKRMRNKKCFGYGKAFFIFLAMWDFWLFMTEIFI